MRNRALGRRASPLGTPAEFGGPHGNGRVGHGSADRPKRGEARLSRRGRAFGGAGARQGCELEVRPRRADSLARRRLGASRRASDRYRTWRGLARRLPCIRLPLPPQERRIAAQRLSHASAPAWVVQHGALAPHARVPLLHQAERRRDPLQPTHGPAQTRPQFRQLTAQPRQSPRIGGFQRQYRQSAQGKGPTPAREFVLRCRSSGLRRRYVRLCAMFCHVRRLHPSGRGADVSLKKLAGP